MKKLVLLLLGCVVLVAVLPCFSQVDFLNSLHATRYGKTFWYSADTSLTGAAMPGFEQFTNIPITDDRLGCLGCHPEDNLDASGDPYPVPYPGASCKDCHAIKYNFVVEEDQCYGCHTRQRTVTEKLNYADVHRDAENPLKCWDCHDQTEFHGDGVAYKSIFEPGAIKVSCADCHSESTGTMPDHSSYDPHNGKLDCDACHMKSELVCYNCHFESQVEAQLKRPKQPIHDFIILGNNKKTGKVSGIGFQSLTYQGKAFVAFGPAHSHTITAQGRICSDCHANMGGQLEAIQQYNSTGEIKFAWWNDSDSTLSWIHGVIPFPEDFESSFKMDFLTYNGNPDDPVTSSKNWSAIGKDQPDGYQLLFAEPLTTEQMRKLGMGQDTGENVYMGVGSPGDAIATSCASCHNSESFAPPVYDEWVQTKHAVSQDSISFLQFYCLPCHNTGWDLEKENGGMDEFVIPDSTAPFGYKITDQAGWDRMKNVQCENCHGPLGSSLGGLSADHAAPSGEPNLGADVCGACHEGSHHPTYSDWQKSKHAVSKFTSIPGFEFIASNPSCAGCHSAEGFIQFVQQQDWEPNVVAPGAEGNDLTCAACHDPHNSQNEGQLRLAADELCQKCHNPEYNPDSPEPAGQELHHTTAWMFEGKGGYEYEGYTYPSSAHTSALKEKCVTCHVFQTPYIGEPEEVPAYTGHSFEPQLGACAQSGCHEGEFVVSDSSFDFHGAQSEIRELLDELGNLLAEATPEDSLTDRFKKAKFNYEFVEADGSYGIHNFQYAKALLETSIREYKRTSDEYAGSDLCKLCHSSINDDYMKSGHPYKLTKIEGGPPVFPSGTSPGVPNPPADKTWDDISYLIGGFGWKARFMDSEGYILTGSTNRQYNLPNSTLGTQAGWVGYDADKSPRKPYTCGGCHTTGWVATDSAGPHQDDLPGIYGTWAEAGVRCEACHGAAKDHAFSPFDVKPSKVERCGSCHSRGDVNKIDASNGLIKHHEQYEGLLASPHTKFACSTCHEPHKSTKYDLGGFKGTDETCKECHSDVEIGIPQMSGFECYVCHMPYAAKSAVSITINYNGGSVPKGDIRTHIFSISTDASWNMFTDDGNYVRKDADGRAHISLDFVCLTCHTNQDLNWAAANAPTIHETGTLVDNAGNKQSIPEEYALYQNYPNPFNPETSIRFDLKESGRVELKIFNLMGQEVMTLLRQQMPAGSHRITFAADNLPSGVYIYVLKTDNFSASKKMIIMK